MTRPDGAREGLSMMPRIGRIPGQSPTRPMTAPSTFTSGSAGTMSPDGGPLPIFTPAVLSHLIQSAASAARSVNDARLIVWIEGVPGRRTMSDPWRASCSYSSARSGSRAMITSSFMRWKMLPSLEPSAAMISHVMRGIWPRSISIVGRSTSASPPPIFGNRYTRAPRPEPGASPTALGCSLTRPPIRPTTPARAETP